MCAWGEELPRELTDAVPADAEQLLDGLHGEFHDHDSLIAGFSLLRDRAKDAFAGLLRSQMGNLALILGVVLLCGTMEELHRTFREGRPDLIPMAGALAVTMLSLGDLRSLIGLGKETIETMELFGNTLLPTLSAAVAASGGIVTAGANQVAAVYFAHVLITLIHRLLMPLAYFYIAVAMADAVLSGHDLKGLQNGIGKAITWGLTGLMTVYIAFFKLSSAAGMAADSTAVHLARSAISVAVPVVGGIISGATETVASGAELLKTSIGIFGTLGIVAICLMPFVHLAVQFLLYKLTAFLSSMVGSESLVKLIDAIGNVFGMVLGMVGACGMILLIAVISSVSVVIR